MVTSRELITVCRQIGGMMEADVDILRITRVLRSQTANQRLLDLYDDIDHELTMGRSLSDALTRAPDVFSPFAISLIRQGEERNNQGAAFQRLAEFLQKESDSALVAATTPETAPEVLPSTTSRPETSPQVLPLQVCRLLAQLCIAWAAVFILVALRILPNSWQTPIGLLLSAVILWRASSLTQATPIPAAAAPIAVAAPQPEVVAPALSNIDPNQVNAVPYDLEPNPQPQRNGGSANAETSLARLKRPERHEEIEESFD
jgi:hypothetical protein